MGPQEETLTKNKVTDLDSKISALDSLESEKKEKEDKLNKLRIQRKSFQEEKQKLEAKNNVYSQDIQCERKKCLEELEKEKAQLEKKLPAELKKANDTNNALAKTYKTQTSTIKTQLDTLHKTCAAKVKQAKNDGNKIAKLQEKLNADVTKQNTKLEKITKTNQDKIDKANKKPKEIKDKIANIAEAIIN